MRDRGRNEGRAGGACCCVCVCACVVTCAEEGGERASGGVCVSQTAPTPSFPCPFPPFLHSRRASRSRRFKSTSRSCSMSALLTRLGMTHTSPSSKMLISSVLTRPPVFLPSSIQLREANGKSAAAVVQHGAAELRAAVAQGHTTHRTPTIVTPCVCPSCRRPISPTSSLFPLFSHRSRP